MEEINRGRLLVNRIMTPDGTILISKHVHDYVSHVDENGELYFTDGGNDYVRRSINIVPATDMCLYENDDYSEIRKILSRGTFDKNGKRIWKPYCELTDSHLNAILEYNEEKHIGNDNVFSKMIIKEMQYRKDNNITIEDKEYY